MFDILLRNLGLGRGRNLEILARSDWKIAGRIAKGGFLEEEGGDEEGES